MLRHKYGAVRTVADGIAFGSKLEARVYQKLKALKDAGQIAMILRQVPLHMPTYRHVVDFLVFYCGSHPRSGEAVFIEAKGRDLPMGKLKRQAVEHEYGIEIELWTN